MTESGPEIYRQAMQTALRLLRGRDLTVAEINARLLTKGFTNSTVTAVVSSLQASGYLKDARIADRAVELAKSERPKGRLRIEMELKARGASERVVQRALVGLSLEDERAAATKEAEKVKASGGNLKQAAGRLARQGYEEETVASVIESVFGCEPGF